MQGLIDTAFEAFGQMLNLRRNQHFVVIAGDFVDFQLADESWPCGVRIAGAA